MPPDGPPPAFRTPQVSTRKLAQERVGPRSLPDLRRARGAGGGGEVCATFTNEINLMDFVRDVHEVYSFLTTDIGFATRAPEVRGSLVG